MNGQPLAHLEAVSRVHEQGQTAVHALRGVDLTIFQGEMVAIMGPSGSGKSTLLNILGLLDQPTSGRYFLAAEPVEQLDENSLAALRNQKIGFVFQNFNLLPRETAQRNVELPLVYAGLRPSVRKERAKAALERVGLAHRLHHLPNELSGGQQQRVAIARALVNNPVLLLADEPTGALDSATTHEIMELFSSLHAQGTTVILVTHDASVAGYAERVVHFTDGAIVADIRREQEIVGVAS